MSAPRDAAARALAQLLRDGEAWPSPTPLRLRNLLLDACGSDHRALVELLLRVGRHGVADALRKLSRASTSTWPAHRTRLVSLACGELFIERDIAAWAVDAWAVALEVIDDSTADALRRDYAEQARRADAERAREEARAAVLARSQAAMATLASTTASATTAGAVAMNAGWPAAAGAMPSLIGGTPAGTSGLGRPLTGAGGLLANPRWGGTAAQLLSQPSWAGGAGTGRVGAWRRGRTGPPRWRVASTPLPPPSMKRFFALFAVVSVCMAGVVGLMRRIGPDLAPPRPYLPLPVATIVDSTRTMRSADSTAVDTRSVEMSAQSERREGASPIGRVTPVPTAATGRAPSPAPAPPSARAFVPRAPFDAIAAGVGGRYRVEQRSVSVYGSGLCDPVADALAERPLQSEESFTHVPGQRVFAMVSRGDVSGTIEPDGVFMTGVHRTTHNNVRLEFRMVGRFTDTGFTAVTMTTTDAVLRYRERQQCVIRADLIGTRVR
ncbi:MAG: hypothetical protein MUD17_01450 [Gemmatimonadaceae bacterium]|nr:hypothetical protein [Gemmatimonadaceae bacterium]